MATAFINSFSNLDRPQPSGVSAKNIPFDQLTPEIFQQLKDSLKLSADSKGHLLASACRLWESILEKHRFPCLVLIVAEMRWNLDSKVTALSLYEELRGSSKDKNYERWVTEMRFYLSEEANKMLMAYKTDPAGNFALRHRWVPTAMDPFPSCLVDPTRLQELPPLWKDIEHNSDINWHDRFRNKVCLETNYLEGTFLFTENDDDTLATKGFFAQSLKDIEHGPVEGTVRNLNDAISILQDTHRALDEIYTFLGPEPRELTVDLICSIHKQLMKTSRVLYNESGPIGCLSYVNIGLTRQATCANVTAMFSQDGKPSAIQFCPYDEVDAELAIFCKRFNEILRKDDMDPYACAAWISHVFVTMHPFEDGNGRLSRILSSIPLVRKAFPPLYVPFRTRDVYIMHLNNTRATPRTGSYQGLMQYLFLATQSALRSFEHLRKYERHS